MSDVDDFTAEEARELRDAGRGHLVGDWPREARDASVTGRHGSVRSDVLGHVLGSRRFESPPSPVAGVEL